MATSTLLFIVGAIVLFVYFSLFSRAINTLTAEERARFYKAGSSISFVLAFTTTIAVFLVPSPYLRVGLAVASITILFWQKKPHHHRLKECGLGAQFIQRLDDAFKVAMIGLTLIFAGAVMEAGKYA